MLMKNQQQRREVKQMPRVKPLLVEDRLENMLRTTYTQRELSEITGIGRTDVSKRLSSMNWRYNELRAIFRSLDISKEEIGEYFK